ncbi:MAG: HlyD family secretion protein [Planctomycetota bacterium]
MARLEAEIARRSLRAPAAGEVAELTPLTRGSWVGAGATLATVVAPGALAVEADFPAAAAVGRIRPGQRGRLRLDGFPWARFGSVPVEVARVGAEARDGLVRVELHLDAGETAVPLGHGLVGTVEVEVERVSPFELLLRSAGRRAPAAVQAEPR